MARGLCVVLALLAGCDRSMPECGPGELRYTGRPPESMFAYDRSCRADCFSYPASACEADCGEVLVQAPTGALLANDKRLLLADVSSLGDGKALAFGFGYIDEAGGTAPEGWTFLAGPGTYVSDWVEGTARFTMDTAVLEVSYVNVDGADILRVDRLVSERIVEPGRLEVLHASFERIAGRFFLSYPRQNGQPEAEVIGCFDLHVSEPLSAFGVTARVLEP